MPGFFDISVNQTTSAPVAMGNLADQTFSDDTGNYTYDTSVDFVGQVDSYSLDTTVTGVSIDSGTGVVTFNTDTMAVQSMTSIVVRATNAGGSVTSGFSVTIAAAGVQSVTIDMRRSGEQIAPEGFHFIARDMTGFTVGGLDEVNTGSYDPRYHDLTFKWSFGEPGATFKYADKLLSEWNNRNTAFGPVATHTYRTPSTYTVTLEVWKTSDPSEYAVATTQFTVNDPDTLYTGAYNVYVDPDGVWDGAPGDATKILVLDDFFVDTICDSANGANDKYRVRFARGKTHYWTMPATAGDGNSLQLGVVAASGFKGVRIESVPGAGTPARVRVDWPTGNASFIQDKSSQPFGDLTQSDAWGEPLPNTPVDVVHRDIIMEGPWDQELMMPRSWVTTAGRVQSPRMNYWYYRERCASYFLVDDAIFEGFGSAFSCNANDQNLPDPAQSWERGAVRIFNDTKIEGWGDYAIYFNQPRRLGMSGVYAVPSSGMAHGGPKNISIDDGSLTSENVNHNNHGWIRLADGGYSGMDACTSVCVSGWPSNSQIPLFFDTQPNLRLHMTKDDPLSGPIMNVQRNYLESRGVVATVAPTNPGEELSIVNAIIANNIMVAGVTGKSPVTIQHHGVTMYNNVIYQANVDRTQFGAMPIQDVFILSSPGASETNSDARIANVPIRLFNNTIATELTSAQGGDNVSAATFNYFGTWKTNATTEYDNVLWCPNLDTPVTPHALETAQATLITTMIDAYRDRYVTIRFNLAAEIPNGGSFTVPYADLDASCPNHTLTSAADFDIDTYNDGGVNDLSKIPRMYYEGAATGNASVTTYPRTNYTFALDGTGLVVTNTSGAAWPINHPVAIGIVLSGNRINVRPSFGNPTTTVRNVSPSIGSTAIGAATGQQPRYDITGALRDANTVGAFNGRYPTP